MPAYDPKRPRPSVGDADEVAPVEALLDAGTPASEPMVEVHDAHRGPDPTEVDLRDASPNGSSVRQRSDVPVAAAPEEGTANRAMLFAGLGAAAVVALVVAVLARRRRRAG